MPRRTCRRAVVPAAGLGSRFLPWSKAMPKEMLPLIDRPVIDYIIEEIARAGITEVLLITSRGKEAITNHFDRDPALERILHERSRDELAASLESHPTVAVHYVRQPEPRGLGHAVALAEGFVGAEPFALLLPDELYSASEPALGQLLGEFEAGGDPVVGLMEVPPSAVDRYGIVEAQWSDSATCDILNMVEKPSPGSAPSTTAICGRYVLTPDIFNKLRDVSPGIGGEIQLTDGLRGLLADRRIRGKLITGVRLDVGTIPAYLETVIRVALGDARYGPGLARVARDVLASPQGEIQNG